MVKRRIQTDLILLHRLLLLHLLFLGSFNFNFLFWGDEHQSESRLVDSRSTSGFVPRSRPLQHNSSAKAWKSTAKVKSVKYKGRVTFDQKFWFEFPKFSYIEWNGISTRQDRSRSIPAWAHFPPRITRENAENDLRWNCDIGQLAKIWIWDSSEVITVCISTYMDISRPADYFITCCTVLTRPNKVETAVHGCKSWLSVWTLSCRCPVMLST